MKKKELTKTEQAYRRFEKRCRFILYPFLILFILLLAALMFAPTHKILLLTAPLMFFILILLLVLASIIGKKRRIYMENLKKEQNPIALSDIFFELFDALQFDGFKGNLRYDKWLYEDYFNNTIDIGFIRNRHEFLLEIDSEAICILADEETDHPITWEIPLWNIDSAESAYAAINDFTQKHS